MDIDGTHPPKGDPATDAPAADAPATADLLTTGDSRVDEAVRQLDDLDSTDVSDHPAVFEDIHQALSDVLDAPAPDQEGR